MRPRPSSLLRSLLAFWLSIFLVTSLATAQPSPSVAAVEPRITRAVDEAQLATLKGNTHPLARTQFDRGAASPTLPLDRMLLVLKRSPEQDAALITLLDQQQDKSSPNYHKWLTPEEFGKHFGPADSDIQAVTAWLQTHGFQVDQVSKGRTVIEFSGTAAMVEEAFHTQIHRYVVKGESHWANASDPQIPEALTPVVSGVWTLHNFLKKPLLRISDEHFPLIHLPGTGQPLATSSSGAHFLSPGDFSLIYGINPVHQSGNNGSGVTIGVVARSDFQSGDLFSFYGIFGLPGPNIGFVWNGPDPGNLGGGEEAEAVLDATWSGVLAPNANVQFVVSASTDTTDGADLSALYIIDNDLADVMTESFGVCEQFVTSAQLTGFSTVASQAAAQGITYMVSTGDTGSSGCDNLSETVATGPVAVNALASTPFNVAVGGTIFNENGHDSSYWSPSTTVPVTALKYIPENVWNESCPSSTCGTSANIAAGGGGPSTVVPKPAWQAGSSLHIPNDGFRDLPDVSLTAALHDPYLICYEGSCSQGFLLGIGGTSASAPSFAGIVALVDNKMGGRVGLANYVLYKLAAGQAQYPSQCNGSNTSAAPNTVCIFNDVTVGKNAVPGPNPLMQFTASSGYDLATGLGSVNVNNLINAWAAATFNSTQTTLTLNPLTIAHGAKVTVDIGVSAASGTPTGNASLLANAGSPPSGGRAVDQFALNGGLVSSTTQLLPGGTNMITAHYPGNATYAASDSTAVQVTVNPEPSTTTVSVLTADSKGNPIPFTNGPYGSFIYLRADVAGNSGFGIPSGTVQFTDGGNPLLSALTLNSQGNTATPNGDPFLSPGSHAIGAIYSGDNSFLTSTAASPVNITISKANTTTAVQASGTTVASGSSVTLTATVDTNSTGNAPSGNVSFLSGGAPLPGNAPLSPSVNVTTGNVQGTATYQTTALPNGQNSITAQYTDDTNYTGSTSSAITVTVAQDFSLAFTGTAGSTMTIAAPGGSGTLTLSVSGQNYTGTVSFTGTACTGLPLGATCSFSPTSVTGAGSTTLTVMTIAAHASFPGSTHAQTFWFAGGSLSLAGVFLLAIPRRKRPWTSVAGLILFAGLLALCSCGGSGGGGGGTPGTPPGIYNVTVTGKDANFSHPVGFTLNLQ